MKYAALTIMRKAGQSFLTLLGSLVLLNLLSNIPAGTVNSVVLAQSPSATPQYSDWSAPVNLGPNINTASGEVQVSITHQGLSLYFSSNRPGGFGQSDNYVSRRTSLNAPWGPAKNLGATINSPSGDFPPSFSPDDHLMFFLSNRPGGFGDYDIWVSHRADKNDDFGWETPTNLGSPVNTSADENDATYFVDPATGKATLYFTSLTRPGGLGDFDIYQSTQNEDGSFNAAILVSELSSPFRDTRMTIRADGLEIIFSSDRPGGSGGIDLWHSTRETTSDVWSTPVNLGPVVNSSVEDRSPSLSADGETLFFSSGRVGGFGLLDIWMSTRTGPGIDNAQLFVRQHYLDFLNREPDAAGLAFWTNQITSCGSDAQCIEVKRINVSAAFFLSIEFKQTGYLVYRLYKSSFGNPPNLPVPIRLSEFLPDEREIGNGVVVGQPGWETALENNKQAFSDEFVNRPRFTSAYPQSMTPGEFVDKLNMNAGNPLSQEERDHLVSDLTTGAKTRAQVLRAVAENADLITSEFNRAFVLMQYFGYLRRDPNSGPDTNFDGYNFWLTKLDTFKSDFRQAEMVKAFLVAGEYRGRFPR